MNAEGITIYNRIQRGNNLLEHERRPVKQSESLTTKRVALRERKLGFEDYKTLANGSIVQIHKAVERGKIDYEDLKEVALLLAKESKSLVQITPSDNLSDELHSKIYGSNKDTEYAAKRPDLKIFYNNGRVKHVEYESYLRPPSSHSVSNMISDGLIQSPRIIVDVRDGIKLRDVASSIKGRLIQNTKNIELVRAYDGTKLITVYSKKIGFMKEYSWMNDFVRKVNSKKHR